MRRKTVVQVGLLCLGGALWRARRCRRPPRRHRAPRPRPVRLPRRPLRPGRIKSSRARASCSTRIVAVVNDGVVLRSELDQQEREIEATRCAQQNVALPLRDGAALAGARAPGARRDPGAARRPRRHQGLGRAGQRRAGRHRQAAEHHSRAAARPTGARRHRLRRATARRCGARSRARCCASATSVQRIVITPRELDQYMPARTEDRLAQ